MDGTIYRADVQGAKETVVKPGETYVHEVGQSGNIIYYVTGEDMQLSAYDTETKRIKVLKKSVAWVIPSPDGSKLAYSLIAENAADDQNGVFITELETGEQTPLLGDIEIADQLRWSPSGKKLLASSAVLKDNAYQITTYVIRLS